jgi:hypothetical protein
MGYRIPEIEGLTEGKTWNGKIYGNAQYGRKVYVNGVENSVSAAQYEKWVADEKAAHIASEKKEAIDAIRYIIDSVSGSRQDRRRSQFSPAIEEIEKAETVEAVAAIMKKYEL